MADRHVQETRKRRQDEKPIDWTSFKYMREDPMYEYCQQRKEKAKDDRIKQLKALLNSSTSSSSDTDSERKSHSKKKKKKKKKESKKRKKRVKDNDSKLRSSKKQKKEKYTPEPDNHENEAKSRKRKHSETNSCNDCLNNPCRCDDNVKQGHGYGFGKSNVERKATLHNDWKEKRHKYESSSDRDESGRRNKDKHEQYAHGYKHRSQRDDRNSYDRHKTKYSDIEDNESHEYKTKHLKLESETKPSSRDVLEDVDKMKDQPLKILDMIREIRQQNVAHESSS